MRLLESLLARNRFARIRGTPLRPGPRELWFPAIHEVQFFGKNITDFFGPHITNDADNEIIGSNPFSVGPCHLRCGDIADRLASAQERHAIGVVGKKFANKDLHRQSGRQIFLVA